MGGTLEGERKIYVSIVELAGASSFGESHCSTLAPPTINMVFAHRSVEPAEEHLHPRGRIRRHAACRSA